MSISIAGRSVKVGDTLYHVGYRTWGTVNRYDTGAAVLRIVGANGDTRDIYVTEGGIVGNARQVYWHELLDLDLPYQNIQKFQQVLDKLVEVWG